MRWMTWRRVEGIGVAVDEVDVAPVRELELHPGGLRVLDAPAEDAPAEVLVW